jgi:ferritin-like metal-binding protein YciE
MRRFRGRNRQGQKQGFQTHLRETENHLKRLEQVSQLAGLKAQGIDGITKEANEVAGEVEPESVLDAALMAAQAVSTTRSRATAP